jgi:general stress protein 26
MVEKYEVLLSYFLFSSLRLIKKQELPILLMENNFLFLKMRGITEESCDNKKIDNYWSEDHVSNALSWY